MKTDFLFCGLPRNIPRFACTLESLKASDVEIGKIIYSTWKNIRTPELDELLLKHHIELIESDEPHGYPGNGHLWYQMLNYQKGMEACDKDNFVFKGRTDLYIGDKLLRTLCDKPTEFLSKNPDDKTFQYRIWVPWMEITCPFYIADECFYGFYDDMIKLVHFDKSYDDAWSPHVIRFAHPFNNDNFPHIKKYLASENAKKEQFNDLFFEEQVRIDSIQEKFSDKRIDYLASYYAIMYKYFRVFNMGDAQTKFKRVQYWQRLNYDAFSENFCISRSRWRMLILLYEDIWIQNIVNQKIKRPDETYDKFYSHLKELL